MALDRKPDDSLETKLTTRAGNVYALYCLTDHGTHITNNPNMPFNEKMYVLELKNPPGGQLNSDFILQAHRALITAGAAGDTKPFITRPAAAGAVAVVGTRPFSKRPPFNAPVAGQPEYKALHDQINTSNTAFRTAYNAAITTADEKIQSVTNRLLCVNSKGFMKRPSAEEWTEAFDIQPAVDALDKMKSDLQKKYDEEVKKVSQVNKAALETLFKQQNDWIEEERVKLLATQAYFKEDLQNQIFKLIDETEINATNANEKALAAANIKKQLEAYHAQQLEQMVFLGKDSKGVPIRAQTAADMKEGKYTASELTEFDTCFIGDWASFCKNTWQDSKGFKETSKAVVTIVFGSALLGTISAGLSVLEWPVKKMFTPTYTLTESGTSKNVGWSSTSFYNSNRYRDKQIDGGFDRYLRANNSSVPIYLTLGPSVSLDYIKAMDARAEARGLPRMYLSEATKRALAGAGEAGELRLAQIEAILSRGKEPVLAVAHQVGLGAAAAPPPADDGLDMEEARNKVKPRR